MSKNINLLIIGKYSFISQNLYSFLKKKLKIKVISFEKFKILNDKELSKYDYICNCSITRNYNNYKYKPKYDNDFFIAEKIKKLKVKYILLSSRKVYFPKSNIKENSKKRANDNYSKNKLITEKKLLKILKKKLLILRISNLIGKLNNLKSNRRISDTFIYKFYKFKKNKVIYYNDFFKDFLSIEQFCEIFYKILQHNLVGIYNVSLGEKVYISEILKALCKNKNMKKFVKIDSKFKDNFFLKNTKLLNKINIKISKKELLKYCYKI